MSAGYTSVLRIPAETRELYNVLHSVIARESDANGSVISMVGWTPRNGAPRRRLRILVAEDNRTNQVVIESILTSANHRVDLVADGEAALDALQKTAYDLVIADLDMPKMGGIEAMRIYGFTHHDLRTPWLILTGDATRETMEECASSGADGFLTKPVKPTLLLARVTQLTESAREARVIAITRPANEPDANDTHRARSFAVTNGLDYRLGEFSSLAGFEIERMQRALLDRNHGAFRVAAHGLQEIAMKFGASAVAQLASDIEAIPDTTLPRVAGTVMHDLVRVYEESRATLAAAPRPVDPA
jgi:two-component system sensor histidine kinase RpfC